MRVAGVLLLLAVCCACVAMAAAEPAPCPAFASGEAAAKNFCSNFAWMRPSSELEACYCSRCSLQCQAAPPAQPAGVTAPPRWRSQRKDWCASFRFLRYGSNEQYYCSQCGCSQPRKQLKAPINVGAVPTEAQALRDFCEENGPLRYGGGAAATWLYSVCGVTPKPQPVKPAQVSEPGTGAARKAWCDQEKSLTRSPAKDYYCSQCRCPLRLAQLGRPTGVSKAGSNEQIINIAAPGLGTAQVHVHVNVAAPKAKASNAGLQAMVARVAKKNEQAAAKMDEILRKIKSQDCRNGDCLPQTKELEKWKAEWILETEAAGSLVP